jgi:mono/diheme cytochrome c family protein
MTTPAAQDYLGYCAVCHAPLDMKEAHTGLCVNHLWDEPPRDSMATINGDDQC